MTTQEAEAAKKNTQINSHTNINCTGSFEGCTATFGSVTNSPDGHATINCNERRNNAEVDPCKVNPPQ